MITGYNTEIRRGDTVFHVQTEDKGTASAKIESLIYVGGRILAAVRTSYADLLDEGDVGPRVVRKLDGQHQKVIGLIRSGCLDQKLSDLMAKSGAKRSAREGPSAPSPAAADASAPAPEAPFGKVEPRVADDAWISVENETEGTLDDAIFSFLSKEAEQDHLVLQVMSEVAPQAGRESSMRLRVASSRADTPVESARVGVQLVPHGGEPQALTSGETNAAGSVELRFTIPSISHTGTRLLLTAEGPQGMTTVRLDL